MSIRAIEAFNPAWAPATDRDRDRGRARGTGQAGTVPGWRWGLRAALHTGEIELRASDVTGIAVHIASRIAAPSEILVSRTVVDLTAGSGLQFPPRGEHHLKALPGTWPAFAAQTSI